jgi:hypothetical protein
MTVPTPRSNYAAAIEVLQEALAELLLACVLQGQPPQMVATIKRIQAVLAEANRDIIPIDRINSRAILNVRKTETN